jgi:hypothetical protein
MEENKNKGQQLNIELPTEVARGVYSNLAIISHSHSEFVLDFVQVISGTPKAEVRSRIIVTPQNAKRLLYALRDNIEKFEMAHGDIHLAEKDMQIPPTFGGGPTGYA